MFLQIYTLDNIIQHYNNFVQFQQELDTTVTKKPQKQESFKEVKQNVSQDVRSNGRIKLNSSFVGDTFTAKKQTKVTNL